MLASLFQFGFLCLVGLANLGLGFAIASRLGWGPDLAALFQLAQAAPSKHLASLDHGQGDRATPAVATGTTADAQGVFDRADDGLGESDPGEASELTATTGSVA